MAVLEPRNFLQPCLLLLLRERADHGYDLLSRLTPMHDGEGDSGGVYRALRGLERRGLVHSQWCTPQAGPARRTYHLTDAGESYLEDQVAELRLVDGALHRFLERYERTGAGRVG
ncbi:helix-turn-helix transcriptional regulator [Pseudonocardia pini]|uniref:helix-turn-helix transcriptional regulator n=1 Tax=Pseudonocardia pini TaxID=2758030 RepID=UPI0015F0CE61|nr:helix-turn-helix transcriptional regulator [Pseudonocardia pini]